MSGVRGSSRPGGSRHSSDCGNIERQLVRTVAGQRHRRFDPAQPGDDARLDARRLDDQPVPPGTNPGRPRTGRRRHATASRPDPPAARRTSGRRQASRGDSARRRDADRKADAAARRQGRARRLPPGTSSAPSARRRRTCADSQASCRIRARHVQPVAAGAQIALQQHVAADAVCARFVKDRDEEVPMLAGGLRRPMVSTR